MRRGRATSASSIATTGSWTRNYYYITWSNAWFNGPCAYWKYKADRPVNVKGSKVHVPILMIGETFDAATPFAGSLVTRRLFPTASLIEGVDGSTHAGSLSGIACTDDAIAAYLTDGTVPARKSGNRSDLKCPPVPQPDPTAAAGLKSLKAQRRRPAAGAARRPGAGTAAPLTLRCDRDRRAQGG